MAEIIGTPEPIEDVTKRFYLPGVIIRDTCPKCGKVCEVDLGNHCIYYPTFNAPMKFSMYCCEDNGGCENEWDIQIVIRVTTELEIAENENG